MRRNCLTAALAIVYFALGCSIVEWAAATAHRFTAGLALIAMLGTAALLCVAGLVVWPHSGARRGRKPVYKKKNARNGCNRSGRVE